MISILRSIEVLTRLAQFSLAREPHVDKVGDAEGSGFNGEENLVRGRGGDCTTDDLRGVGVKIIAPHHCTGEGA